MELAIISYNVCGLMARLSKTRLRTFLKDSYFDICFLQEHKLCQAELPLLGKSIWKEGFFYRVVAEDGVHAACNNSIATRKGGLAIGVSAALNTFVTHSHSTPCGRAQFVHLDGLPIGPMGVLNVYGPHTYVERSQLWHTILLSIDDSRPWILGGDWNFAEHANDQIGGLPKDLSGDEAAH